jgi:hypothetical protein
MNEYDGKQFVGLDADSPARRKRGCDRRYAANLLPASMLCTPTQLATVVLSTTVAHDPPAQPRAWWRRIASWLLSGVAGLQPAEPGIEVF